ncbi:hypothetical protein IB238_02710 [Rhizobium sp. ARZ01]|uniref:hypothetical protein n=1 Tax=Rhizobium sp. ARZ01 TaxID=2769313 RepID=UPI0017801BBB|nr:hypothetical protein [Rhizobium sp. ARZ01]MBD9371552.1 hypothetical protein [Rhizobium sp. ARZ01]
MSFWQRDLSGNPATKDYSFRPFRALHDAANVSSVLLIAMMFVPSKGGISHNLAEDTDRLDLTLGAEVLAGVVASLISKVVGVLRG